MIGLAPGLKQALQDFTWEAAQRSSLIELAELERVFLHSAPEDTHRRLLMLRLQEVLTEFRDDRAAGPAVLHQATLFVRRVREHADLEKRSGARRLLRWLGGVARMAKQLQLAGRYAGIRFDTLRPLVLAA